TGPAHRTDRGTSRASTLGQVLLDPAHLLGQLAGVTGPDVGLEDQADPVGALEDGVGGPLEHGHDLVTLGLDVGEHGVGLRGQARLADDPYRVGDGPADRAVRVGRGRGDAEGYEHAAILHRRGAVATSYRGARGP